MRKFILTSILLLIVILDQITKAMILSHFSLGESRIIIPNIFNLTLAFNTGAAFGLFTGFEDSVRRIILSASTAAALLVVVILIWRGHFKQRAAQLALMLILGGAIGNVIDRIRLGYVVDFLDFYFRHYHWPAFNVADSAICVGVFILLLAPSNEQLKN